MKLMAWFVVLPLIVLVAMGLRGQMLINKARRRVIDDVERRLAEADRRHRR